MKQIFRLLAILFLAAIYSCNQSQDQRGVAAEAPLEKPASVDKTEVSQDNLVIERKIIKEGEIRFETSNAPETKEIISKSVAEFKGYISNDNVFDYKDKVEYRITIRVPAEKFESLLDRISLNAKKLDSKNINALDITEEFIDIEARTKTKKELENRYKEILKQAKTVEEILTIEKEIGALRTEIESIEGRLKYLQDKVSFSTLTVVFYEKTSSSFGFNSKFGEAFHNGWTNLLLFFVAMANLWPFILIVLTIILLYKLQSKRNKQKNAI
ncbi:MAG: DUF4349 domain-containing protein [Saprospiraceae bacterium]|nr:DUF4349 domain-containing protein [Saprospiraceae bacterium]